jgi:peptide deformylase
MRMGAGESPVQRAAAEFVAEFARWRAERGLSKKQLAAAMGFDPSYLSHVEAHRHRPTEDFAKRAEAVLQTGGSIWRRFRQYDELRATSRGRSVGPVARAVVQPEQWLPPGAGLVVERETARLSYVDGRYRCTVRRALYNAGAEPVTRYLIRIAVDRYPNESERSNVHHRSNPLSWDELHLVAACGGERMDWRPKTDRDAFKEAWLLFENPYGRFPLYPGQRATIQYTYHVGADKWGRWFQRAVRVPTRRLRIELDLPMSMRPVVWGVETTLSAEAVPLRTPIEQEIDGDRAVFAWSTEDPPLHARYRLEWRFRGAPTAPGAMAGAVPGPRSASREERIDGAAAAEPEDPADRERGPPEVLTAPLAEGVSAVPAEVVSASPETLSARMAAAGIVQRGAEVLRTPARWFDLPRDAPLADETVSRLIAALNHVAGLHEFRKGMGLAAPQLGLSLAAAVVQPVGTREPIVLLNPRVIAADPDSDEQFEGCLSFFDVRGLVKRPLRLTVESTLSYGQRIRVTYEQAVARLVAHEVDHLDGQLYVDRMAPGAPLVPIEEYEQTGRPWAY